MNRTLEVNLSTGEIKSHKSTKISLNRIGRGLATSLVMEKVDCSADYFDETNCIVITPGFLTGTQAPTTGRLTIAAKGGKTHGIKSINIAGPISQKMASLGIEAIIITGINKAEAPAILHITEDNIEINYIKELKYKSVEETIDYLVHAWGQDTSILGIGPAGEHVMAIASVFSTYPNGYPKYYCTRGKMGDLFGYKGLKAVAVTTKKHFNSSIFNEEEFRHLSKELSKIIINHPVCGGALPAYGSITLIKMMKDKEGFLKELQQQTHEIKKNTNNDFPKKTNIKINKNCAPNCVIGCLNRHRSDEKSIAYSSPAESEALAACQALFEITDHQFVSRLNKKCFDLGLDTIEFLFSCSMLLKGLSEEPTKEKLMELLEEIERLTPLGRIAASTTKGIYPLFSELRELEKMVTVAAATEESNFNISITKKLKECEDIRDLQYLYGCMTAMGNLGICLFATFAILDSDEGLELLAKLIGAKTGENVFPQEIINSALDNLRQEKDYDGRAKGSDFSNSIPEFVKVLYRYFGKEVQS
ncbi:aldehyde ferredoxin oxidoreductase N-terminal domain-containing protein [Natronincola ferrireducens]|uniref:Aldehyde ferredoxin oxidoreductase n=1 Tax=Natronincola ferrireducens TaxID=393762 RepID=A0A1G9GM96_9FIRM|nr:aldehyde ferredoxin oxidoreductase N-terminal domain-containing protein [Natronincola ferrireducens]SDL01625.1 Aldehyde ferredoxin oxidoreductase [Natronincola ferrireducens]